MAARVSGWLLTSNLRTGPGARISLGNVLRDRQPWRFPLKVPSLGLAVLVVCDGEGELGPHELGFALSYEGELIAPPLIVDFDLAHERSWVFVDRGPHELPGPGTYNIDISIDGEIAEEGQITLEDITKRRKSSRRKAKAGK